MERVGTKHCDTLILLLCRVGPTLVCPMEHVSPHKRERERERICPHPVCENVSVRTQCVHVGWGMCGSPFLVAYSIYTKREACFQCLETDSIYILHKPFIETILTFVSFANSVKIFFVGRFGVSSVIQQRDQTDCWCVVVAVAVVVKWVPWEDRPQRDWPHHHRLVVDVVVVVVREVVVVDNIPYWHSLVERHIPLVVVVAELVGRIVVALVVVPDTLVRRVVLLVDVVVAGIVSEVWLVEQRPVVVAGRLVLVRPQWVEPVVVRVEEDEPWVPENSHIQEYWRDRWVSLSWLLLDSGVVGVLRSVARQQQQLEHRSTPVAATQEEQQ